MRQLSLHASALNDVEYDLYTSSLNDLAWTDNVDQTSVHDDAYYDKMKLGVREARGWLRGRYSHVAPGDIDSILRFFSPDLNQADTLSGGQFFAALRLVIHVETGKVVDRALAFVQAQPKSGLDTLSPSRQPQPDLPPPTPMRQSHGEDSNPFSSATPMSPPPFHPLSRKDVSKSQPITHATHNPFVNRSTKPISNDHPVKGPPLPPRKPAPPTTISAHSALLPPPRHNSILLPPTGRKSVSPTRAMTPGSATLVPAPVVLSPGLALQPSSGKASHVTSNLMKQSLQASKAGQTMKKAEEQLEQERVMQVLKSSSVVSGTNIRNRSSSPTKFVYAPSTGNTSSSSRSDERAPPLPRRRAQQQPSPPVSISSLEEVAFAATNSQQGFQYQSSAPPSTGGLHGPRPIPSTYTYTPSTGSRGPPDVSPDRGQLSTTPFYSSPASSPSRPSVDLPQPPGQPPTHPDRERSHFPYRAPTNFSSSSTISSHTSETHVDKQNRQIGPSSGSNYSTSSAPHESSNTVGQYSPFRNANPTTPEGSPSARVFRSKSMHHPSPPLPPLPPPIRRKRPESVQVLKSGEIIFGGTPSNGNDPGSPFKTNDGRRPGSTLSRHTSLSSPGASGHRRSSLSMSSTASAQSQPQPSYDSHASPMTNIQRTIATLQPKLDGLGLQPRLDKARYKAEAGISRRGFVKDTPRSGSKGSSIGRSGMEGEEKEDLLSGSGDSDGAERRERLHDYGRPRAHGTQQNRELDDGEMDSDETGDGPGDGDGEREWRRMTRERWAGKEMDELKWPAGEGWKPL